MRRGIVRVKVAFFDNCARVFVKKKNKNILNFTSDNVNAIIVVAPSAVFKIIYAQTRDVVM